MWRYARLTYVFINILIYSWTLWQYASDQGGEGEGDGGIYSVKL